MERTDSTKIDQGNMVTARTRYDTVSDRGKTRYRCDLGLQVPMRIVLDVEVDNDIQEEQEGSKLTPRNFQICR